MIIHKFYEEVDGDITKLNTRNEKELENNIDTVISLYKNLTYFKLVLKKYGAAYIFKLANVTNNVTVADITDWVKCKENDYRAFMAYVAEETGVDILKITTWLNGLTLEEGFNQAKEKKAIFKLKNQLELISQSKSNYLYG